MYDIECPICMLCYSKENPPINLYCSEHQSRPFVLCKNEMIYYYMKSDKKKDMAINCPICHNDIKFKTAGKKEKEVMGLFEVNT